MGSNAVVVALVLGGCSFVYNPTNLGGAVDADSIADVDPTMLTLTDVYPAHVYEGAGTGNSRASLLVVYGHQIAPDATVTIMPVNPDPSTVTITSTVVARDHDFIALTVRVEDDLIDDDNLNVPLSIAVSQSAGAYHAELPSSVMLMHLNRLSVAPTETPPKQLYATIAISDPITFATGKSHVILRAVGSIQLAQAIAANASLTAPGPGGCPGGAIGADAPSANADGLSCTGRGFTVAPGGLSGGGGGGAGFHDHGDPGSGGGGPGGDISGTIQLADATLNAAAGGGGGATAVGGGGAAGGGGGGSIEITAGGDVSIGAVSANGASGANANSGGGGGGGAGGAILVRAGGTATIGPLSVTHGDGGTSGSLGTAGGAGSVGRTRIDAPNILAGAGYFGPTFIAPPATSPDPMVTLMLHGEIGDTTMVGQAFDRDGNAIDHGNFTPAFNGTGVAMPSLTLKAGYNLVCVTVQGGNAFTLPESANCTEIAFLP
ncbi:MAG: hypothetical protein ABI591_16805 [Kofleriaceae bacterium]